jgi:hypothetical protein
MRLLPMRVTSACVTSAENQSVIRYFMHHSEKTFPGKNI